MSEIFQKVVKSIVQENKTEEEIKIKKLLKHTKRRFVFDRDEYSRYILHATFQLNQIESPFLIPDEVLKLESENLMGETKMITAHGVRQHNQDPESGHPADSWYHGLQCRVRCKTHQEILTDGEFFPYRVELRNKLPYDCDTKALEDDDYPHQHEWEGAAFAKTLRNALDQRTDALSSISTICCFGRGFRCFNREKFNTVSRDQHNKVPEEQPYAFMYMLGALALNISQSKTSKQPTRTLSETIPKIRIVGQDYCRICHLFLDKGLRNALPHNEWGTNTHFFSRQKLSTAANDFSFLQDFGPKMLIVCCDAEDPVYQIVADLYRQVQGRGPGAFLDGTKISGSSTNLPNKRNPHSRRFEEMLAGYTSDTLHDPAVNKGESYKYEDKSFPDTKWTLYVAK